MNFSRSTWVWPSPKAAAWSQKSRSLNWTYLCATFGYSVQVWTGTGLEPVTECCSEVKLPLLDCKCTLCAAFCLPDLSCASSAARVGETNSIAQRNDERGDRHLLMNNYCLPHPFEQRHYHRAVHVCKAHWWAPQHHADLPERIHGAKNIWPSTKQGTEHYRPFALLN